MISKILQILKSFSRSLEHFFLTVRQNNFGNKIPLILRKHIFSGTFGWSKTFFAGNRGNHNYKFSPINKLSLIYIGMKQANKIINFLIENC